MPNRASIATNFKRHFSSRQPKRLNFFMANMDSLKVYYDEVGQTLTVWFDDPVQEYIAEETEEEVILIKNQAGRVIGFERLNYISVNVDNLNVELVKF
jgi:hypothetical protein